jgi:long-subunit fatty acid transport protein
LELRNALTTTGTGLDFKCGVIVRPVPEVRIGLAYNSGTYYAMTDAFQASLAAWNFINPATNLPYTPDPKSIGDEESVDYIVRTPSKMTFSFAYVFNKIGLVSVDVERVENNKHNLMNDEGYEITEVNHYFPTDFKSSFNVRIGSEIRVNDNYSLRIGGAWYQSPLVKNLESFDIACPYTRPEYSILRDTWYSSIGFGYRNGAFYVDAALQEKVSNENFFFFSDWEIDPENNPNLYANNNTYTKLTRRKVSAALTFGYKF